MESANFIPLGSVTERVPLDQPDRPPKTIGTTKEKGKSIAREVRLAARQEKKKIKSDAKKQRKQNAILHRRMTRNNENYSKNKERNRQRAIDLERTKIRMEAVKQAERLAAKYDPSGKIFNVGEVVVLDDGSVKSKERLHKTEEIKLQRKKEKKAAEEAKQFAEVIKKATKEAKKRGEDPATAITHVEGINPECLAHIQTTPAKHISNTQKRKQEMFAPKPVIPEGIALPEGEENMISLWDITDKEIQKRLNEVKRKKGLERAAFKKQQKKEKIFRRAMKAKKKQADNRGEDFDPEKAAKEILEGQKNSKTTPDSESDSDSDSGSGSSSDSSWDPDSDSGSEAEVKPAKRTQSEVSAKVPEAKFDSGTSAKSKKRSNSEITNDEHADSAEAAEERKHTKSKKSKKSASEDVEMGQKPPAARADKPSAERQKENKSKPKATLQPPPEAVKQIGQREQIRLKKEKKRQEKLDKADEVAKNVESSSKKRKRSKFQEEAEPTESGKPEKSHKKKKVKREEPAAPAEPEPPAAITTSNGHTKSAEQWNPDALTGDEARKEKFLRLLGAGKSNGAATSKHKLHTSSADISRVQSELERQYEAGMRMKHDGGSKRRGLGA